MIALLLQSSLYEAYYGSNPIIIDNCVEVSDSIIHINTEFAHCRAYKDESIRVQGQIINLDGYQGELPQSSSKAAERVNYFALVGSVSVIVLIAMLLLAFAIYYCRKQ